MSNAQDKSCSYMMRQSKDTSRRTHWWSDLWKWTHTEMNKAWYCTWQRWTAQGRPGSTPQSMLHHSNGQSSAIQAPKLHASIIAISPVCKQMPIHFNCMSHITCNCKLRLLCLQGQMCRCLNVYGGEDVFVAVMMDIVSPSHHMLIMPCLQLKNLWSERKWHQLIANAH